MGPMLLASQIWVQKTWNVLSRLVRLISGLAKLVVGSWSPHWTHPPVPQPHLAPYFFTGAKFFSGVSPMALRLRDEALAKPALTASEIHPR